jgi:hypothetical protein
MGNEKQIIDFSKDDNHFLKNITRLEIIDDTGRAYVTHNIKITLSIQDEGRTLKIFTDEKGIEDDK